MSNRKLIGQRLMEGRKTGRSNHQRFRAVITEKKRVAEKEKAIGPKRKDERKDRKEQFAIDKFSDDEVLPHSGNDST